MHKRDQMFEIDREGAFRYLGGSNLCVQHDRRKGKHVQLGHCENMTLQKWTLVMN